MPARHPDLDVVIRRARASDARAIREISRTIWGGHDYVPRVFPRWVRSRRDPLLVASVDDKVVGVARLSWLAPGEAWLEGLRIHARYRRRGVARALVAARILLAVARGARAIAYSTGERNPAMQRAARRTGFQRAATFATLRARARAGEGPRRARRSDLAAIRRVAGEGWLHVGLGWRWRPLASSDLTGAVARGTCFVAGEPIAAVTIADRTGDADEPRQLQVRYSAGSGAALRSLAEALRAEAARRHLTVVYSYAPTAATRSAFARAGFTQPWRELGLLYRKTLR